MTSFTGQCVITADGRILPVGDPIPLPGEPLTVGTAFPASCPGFVAPAAGGDDSGSWHWRRGSSETELVDRVARAAWAAMPLDLSFDDAAATPHRLALIEAVRKALVQ